MREVAELAEVAISSVSRVLSGHPDVSADMKARVLDAVAQLEYEPDFLAQSLRRGQTLSVGFVLADISNPLMADIVHGAEAILRAAGYSLVLMNSDYDVALDAAHIRFFQSRRVDGMILSLSSETNETTLEAIRSASVPIVVVDRELPPEYGASGAVNAHAAGMEAAVRHLVGLGHRRIALITGSPEQMPGRERVRGMEVALADAGADVTSIYLPGSFASSHGEAATRGLLARPERPTAIIAGGNQLLIGCLRVLQEAGLVVGRDISLVTCDDVPLSTLYQPPIASIARDTVALGRMAAELLLERLGEDGGPPRRVVLPTVFTPRPSCVPPRG
ncbi:MAG TPA: LacI family DNA-binding transcriptional regulator [Candidatus Sulfomarinibacteraceae bacterium]|nr:LacI family DNA-binding transcriptional regulator [Candidatus Sulfomarinibacteraceae bacterium]